MKFVIPWKPNGDKWRDKAQAWQEAEFERLGIPVVYTSDPGRGLFSVARAMNSYLKENEGDFIILGADQIPSLEIYEESIERLKVQPYFHPFDETWDLTEKATDLVIAGKAGLDNMSPLTYTAKTMWATGVSAMRYDVWRECPWDERFVGWGGEDTAQRVAMNTMFDKQPIGTHKLIGLYHVKAAKDNVWRRNKGIFLDFYGAYDGNKIKMAETLAAVKKRQGI